MMLCSAARSLKKSFEQVNCENVHNTPLGFDTDFHETGKTYLEGKIHFGLMGKWGKKKTHFQYNKTVGV